MFLSKIEKELKRKGKKGENGCKVRVCWVVLGGDLYCP